MTPTFAPAARYCQHDESTYRYNLLGVRYCPACRTADVGQVQRLAREVWKENPMTEIKKIPNLEREG